MRVLLAQNMPYLPGHGGATKSNRLMLEDLAAQGHECAAVTTLTRPATELLSTLERLGALVERISEDAVVYAYRGVRVHAVTAAPRLPGYLRRTAAEFAPDRTLVPSDDPGQLVLGTTQRSAALRSAALRSTSQGSISQGSSAQRSTRGGVVYLIHTLQQLPFGPRAFYPSEAGRDLVGRCAGAVAVSRAAQEYARRWGGLESTLIYPHVYGPGPYPRLGRPTAGAVTMVNPCGFKGLPILLALADARPDLPFLAVAGWGTTGADRAELARRPNITVTPAVDDIAAVLSRTRVLLMPSLWDETFGYTAVEAMLHGVPVLAADVGGLREAKLGVPRLLPVRPIVAYRPQAGGAPFPEPILPPQDPAPWVSALRDLEDPARYADIADRGAQAAVTFVVSLDRSALGRYLTDLPPTPPPADMAAEAGKADVAAGVGKADVAAGANSADSADSAGEADSADLTPERRAALLALLARRQ